MPYAIEVPDRVRKERYYDPEFFRLEVERLWPRVWQMACRLEEIPRPGDFVDYDILDQSVIVVRTDGGAVAFQNACRHRGVRLVEGRGTCESGFTCPFHGWCYGADGRNTFVSRPRTFSDHNLQPGEIDLVPVRCEVWGGCAWINLDDDAPPLRSCIEPFATVMDAWKLESMRAEWWHSFRLPVNWKLAEEAFMEQYHVIETHPQLRIPGRYPPRTGPFDPQAFLDAELHYLRTMSVGMAGMVHDNDVRIAEAMQDIELPADPALARSTWDRALNDAVVAWHRDRGADVPDLNELEAQGMNEPMGYCFPHFFVLPMYSDRVVVPLPTARARGDLDGHLVAHPVPGGGGVPTAGGAGALAVRRPPHAPIPTQDFSNLPRQQRGLHARGFEYMRLSEQIEGHIANFHRVLDGYLAGLPPPRSHTGAAPAERQPPRATDRRGPAPLGRGPS